MNKWMKQCGLELRLVLGNPLLVLLPVLYGVAFLLFALDAQEYIEPRVYSQLISVHSVAHTISLGPAMMLGILTVRRDMKQSSYEWNRSLPVSFGMLLSSKYLVAVLYMSLFTLPTSAAIYAISVNQGVSGAVALRLMLNIALQAEVSYLVTVALAMLLAVCIPNRVVYLIGFCAWMFGTFFMDIFLIEQSGFYALKTFHLNQFFLTSNPLTDETWGYELFRGEMNQSRMFVLSFTMLLLTVCLLLLNRTRPTMNMKWHWLAVAGAALLSTSTFIPYATLWQDRYASVQVKKNDPSIRLAETVFSKDERLNITKYDIALKRQKDDLLVLHAKLEVPHKELERRTTFPLTLHRGFEVNKVLVQGVDNTYRRQGDHLNIDIPSGIQGDMEIEISYRGKMMEFLQDYNGEKYPVFSVGAEVNLPKSMAWYPLPGHQDVYVKDVDPARRIFTGFRYSGMYFPPAEMRLKVEGYSNPLYTGIPELVREKGYQLFEGKEVMGLTLIGSRDWLELKQEGLPVTVVTTPFNREYTEGMLEVLKEQYDYFTQWIPELKPDITHIMYIGSDIGANLDTLEDEHSKRDNGLILSFRNYTYDSTSGLSGTWMNNMLFGSQEGLMWYSESADIERDVRGKISSLFWYMYLREAEGLSNEEVVNRYGWTQPIQLLTMKDPDMDPKGIGRQMLKQVSQALAEGKDVQVKELLLHFYNQGIFQPGSRDNLYLNERPISLEEWLQEWDRIVGDAGTDSKK
ncbi:ABC transporter permease [Paenibacillus dakarensis]|uniref:ABC transporter permease n=1 Tax=Paenibacillus dakarensis TaxID=1527293 RepID=UPI0006D5ACBF|nr:ABC transporter permease [Paenibacillus dakarensis]